MKKWFMLLAVAVSLLTTAPSFAQNIVEVAAKNPELSTLVKLIEAAGLVDTLKGQGPFTVLAPNNAAFEKVPKEVVAELLKPENKDKLKSVLLFHVVGEEYTTATLEQAPVGTSGPSLNGENLTLTSINPIMVNNIKVVKADVSASNGVIHIVEGVLIPSNLKLGEKAEEAKPATVPPAPAKPKLPESSQTITEIAASDPQFSILVAALKAAGLDETLAKRGPFTVFAPTNAAFAKLPKGTVEDLLKPENRSKLVAILTYHLVPMVATAADVVELNGKQVSTVNRAAKLTVSTQGGVKVNTANVTKTDIPAKNGVIHVIDTVLIP